MYEKRYIDSIDSFYEFIEDDTHAVTYFLLQRGVILTSWDGKEFKINSWNAKEISILSINTARSPVSLFHISMEDLKKYKSFHPAIDILDLEKFLKKQKEGKHREELLNQQKNRKSELLKQLGYFFENNYLKVNNFYFTDCQKDINQKNFEDNKIEFIKQWVLSNLGNYVSREQSLAISSVNAHVLVTARAGSGKTSTIVNRALFLQKHCGIAPNEMLLLAFNRKAAEEIKNRLFETLEDQLPHLLFLGLLKAS